MRKAARVSKPKIQRGEGRLKLKFDGRLRKFLMSLTSNQRFRVAKRFRMSKAKTTKSNILARMKNLKFFKYKKLIRNKW